MKKPYLKPKFMKLGTITNITQAKNHSGCDAPGGTYRQNKNVGYPPGTVSNCG